MSQRVLERYATDHPTAVEGRRKQHGNKWRECPCGICGRRFPLKHHLRERWEALCPHLQRMRAEAKRVANSMAYLRYDRDTWVPEFGRKP